MDINLVPQHTTVVPAQKVTISDHPTWSSTDSPARKTVSIHFDGTNVSFPLWQGAAYDQAGDYTQAQLDAAVNAWLVAHKA